MNEIKKMRQSKGLTQADLARRLGISQQALSAYERGSRSPDADIIESVARIAGGEIAIIAGPIQTPSAQEEASVCSPAGFISVIDVNAVPHVINMRYIMELTPRSKRHEDGWLIYLPEGKSVNIPSKDADQICDDLLNLKPR